MHHPPLNIPQIQVLSIDEILELPTSLVRKRKYFTLLLAWDSLKSNDSRIGDVFRSLVRDGLAYFCAWGLNCEAIHDLVDAACIDLGVGLGENDHLCMTTWHSEESLEEAAWFFTNLAIPSEQCVFEDFERFAVAVANPTWAAVLRNPK